MTSVRRYQDLIAWQTGDAFHDEIARLIEGSPAARRNFKFCDQILDAAESVPHNIAEGFLRYSSRELCRFIDIALGSLVEAESRLRKRIRRKYFAAADCEAAFRLACRCLSASIKLKKSQKDPDGR
jgi:four helix bundle protein